MLRVAIAASLSLTFGFAQEPAQTAAPTPEPPVILEGRVLDLRGEPVPLAEVWVNTWWERDKVLARSVCDGEGCFRIGKVPLRSSWLVLATKAGMNVATDFVSHASEPIELRLHDAATLHGVLRNAAGAPVAGVEVRGMTLARAMSAEDRFATTDAQGAFEMTKVALGRFRAAACVPDEGLYEARAQVTGDAEITLTRVPGARTAIAITVKDVPPELAPAVAITLLPNGASNQLPPPGHRPRLDANGTCKLTDLPDTNYTVYLSCEGLVFQPNRLEIVANNPSHVMEFRASPRGTVAVHAILQGLDDQPIAGVKLAMRLANSSQQTEATSTADGTLTFASHLGIGAAAIVQSLDDHWALHQERPFDHGGTDPRTLGWHEFGVDGDVLVHLRAVPSCSATGRVLLMDGRPAAFVPVELEEETNNRIPRWMSFAYGTTDRNGCYRFLRLHPMPEQLRVTIGSRMPGGRSGGSSSAPFALEKAGARCSVPDLQLAPSATIEGTVVNAQKQPAPGVYVWLRDWDFEQHGQKSGSVVEVITDRQGRYRFAGVAAGGAWLQVFVGEEAPTARAVEPFEVETGKTYTFDLDLPAK